MPVPALWGFRKLTTIPFLVGGNQVELTKYAQVDFLNRVVVRVVGSIDTKGGAAGAASGRDNPEGLLINAQVQTQPLYASAVPFNQVSGRGLRWDAAIDRGYLITPTAIVDGGGVVNVDWSYEFVCKRQGVRKSIQYGLDMTRYKSILLSLQMGDQSQLFTGSANVWSFANCNIEIWADSAFSVDPDGLHAWELFEQNYPILATQSDFPINQLPPGWLYTDLTFLMEDNNALSNAILNNIDVEGGGRVWTPAGDSNAKEIQRSLTTRDFDGSVGLANLVGVYSLSMKDGMYSRQIDALKDPIVIKLNVTGPGGGHSFNARLVGRRMVPYGVQRPANLGAGHPKK